MFKVIISILFILFMQGCSSEKKESLILGLSPWPGYEPLVLGLEKGFYGDLDIRIVRFSTPTESFRSLRDGAVNVAAFTADEVLHYAQARQKPKMFLVLDISNGGDAIVANKEIATIDDLKNKNICLEPSALGHYMIHRSMDFSQNLNIKDIKTSSVDIGDHVKMYKQGQCDAVVTYEPYRSLLLQEGAHVIFDSKKIPNEILDVLVTEEKILKTHKISLKQLSDGWFKTIEYINNNKQEAMKTMAAYEYISADEFEKAYDELIIPSKESNIKILGSTQESYAQILNNLSKLMFEKGSITKDVYTPELISDSIVKDN